MQSHFHMKGGYPDSLTMILKGIQKEPVSMHCHKSTIILPWMPFSDQLRLLAIWTLVFLSRNYQVIHVVDPWKFDVFRTNICLRSKASRANMTVLRTSNFQGATIKQFQDTNTLLSLLFTHRFSSACLKKSYWIIFNFSRWKLFKSNVKFEKENRLKPTSFNFACLQKNFHGQLRSIWVLSSAGQNELIVSLQINTIAACNQFKLIRSRENLVVNYNLR